MQDYPMQEAHSQVPPLPWHAQRWPWLLMLGPALVLAAGVVTTWLAYTRQDAMVVGDYYKQGKAINQDLRRARAASALELSFQARYNPASARLFGSLHSGAKPYPGRFLLRLAHPTQPAKDLQLWLQSDASGAFDVSLPMLELARWQLVLEGEARDWRMGGEWQWPRQRSVAIVAN